jgi:hypothetical protein
MVVVVTVRFCGTDGGCGGFGVTLPDAALAAEVPTAFVAVTVKV